MLTSIVIPTHNRAEMVRTAIDSALALPGGPRELIVVNDGSTDHTTEVLASYGDRIRVFAERHGERSRTRNAGLRMATGEWVAFVDDDDFFLPSGLELLEAAARSAPAEVAAVYGKPRYLKTDPENPLLDTLPPGIGQQGWIFPQLMAGNFIVMGNVLARRSVLDRLAGFDARWPPVEDYDLWLRVAREHPLQFVDTEVAQILLHGTNSSSNLLHSGKMTLRVQDNSLFSPECLAYARTRAAAGDADAAPALAARCLDAARRRWWEGDNAGCRAAWQQAYALHPASALGGLNRIWRAWVPVQRPAWLRRAA